jgi:hypothetical protein
MPLPIITLLSLLRSSGVRRREDERVDAIAAGGGWSLEGGRGLKMKKRDGEDGHKKARMRERESIGQIPSSLTRSCDAWEKCCAHRLVSAPPTRNLHQQ